MYLREFDTALDLKPDENELSGISSEHGLTREEALRFWHKNIGNRISRQFSLENRCIFSFYERIFGKVQIGSFRKVYILAAPESVSPAVKCVGGVCDVNIGYDHRLFYNLCEDDKKKQSLELLMRGLRLVAGEYGFDCAYFEKYAAVIREAGYNNEWVWARRHNGGRTAELRIFHNVGSVDIAMSVSDKQGKCLGRYIWSTDIPDEWKYAGQLGSLVWESKNTAVWYDKAGNVVRQITVE